MKKMLELPIQLNRMQKNLKGVFCRDDLANLFTTGKNITLSKRVDVLIKNGYLKRALRGYYYVPGATLIDLAQRVFPNGYISLETALSLHGMIGTRAERRVEIITTNARPKTFLTDLGTIDMKIIDPVYFSDFYQKEGLNVACAEKAFIDTCYFYFRKNKYGFSISTDINIMGIDPELVLKILINYKNKKFIIFTKGLLKDYGCEIR